MNNKSNEDIDNKEDNNIEVKKKKKRKKKIIINVRKKVLRREEITIDDVSSSNALNESLTDSRNGKSVSRGKYVRKNSSSKGTAMAVQKARFFDQEYNIREIPNCPISEILLNRKKKK
ncbi:conserved Plasmodium protein, unknown function [Plasmodium knowlesi strain H]|uniref:Uncharacterized protein n=3 Tax=Plasmodium knowlesi TaxID=5850 RepID=A0A1A7VZQ9_PLAKH|nr:conserved Plasmodium protein, unknown function [Plasmodium knowlesi strain H]OTN68613.1 Uncharacterized protein PKNOH_S01013100 [Plasmodium knowlesi]CAA9986132.1 conserved Plasmodium protein, unknown function [Plasmodium knowlesi strain H]SBO25308.1 conserved Plasmodium protein, unknown function [Plasmodium knowlesi strain H]SBO27628.1 conserved Plasmodium protein, unknown function [Plasmodium knowlesi strain H]VVS75606.1 conserved Plasmodium protein, unknown function [Plasmodium knowlesi s